MFTGAVNLNPAITFLPNRQPNRGNALVRILARLWLGIGKKRTSPAFVLLACANRGDQPLYARLWGSDFLNSRYQGVCFRFVGRSSALLSNGAGVCGSGRRAMVDRLSELNKHDFQRGTRSRDREQYRPIRVGPSIQISVPEVTDLSKEPDEVFELNGQDARKPGTFAANCLLARRFAQKGVRFINSTISGGISMATSNLRSRSSAGTTDQATATLIKNLKRLGNAGRHAHRLGRRVRENFLIPGSSRSEHIRPRPPSLMPPGVHGRRRASNRGPLTAERTITDTTSRTRMAT